MSAFFLAPIADHIRKICCKGFVLDASTWHFLQNTIDDPTPDSVAAMLTHTDDCESDSLIELVFYPLESMQLDLEPAIESRQLNLQERAHLIALLLQKPLIVPLVFSTLNARITLTMPEPAISQFVNRLNLTYQFPPELLACIYQNLPEPGANEIKVRLRNANIALSDHQTELMIRIFTCLDNTHPDYHAWIDFVLGILAEITPETHIYNFLADKKKFYVHSIERAEHFLKKLHHSNMETLMLQGERAAHIHPQDGRTIIGWIDRISLSLFGRTEFFQSPNHNEITIASPDPHQNLPKLVDFLSS